MLAQAAQDLKLGGKRPVALQQLRDPVDALVNYLKVGDDKLHVDDVHVAHGIDAAVYVNYASVLKAPDDVNDGVHLADVRKEPVSQSLALRRALDKPRDIDEFDDSRREFFRAVHFGKPVEPLVRDRNDPHVRLDGAERIVRRLGTRIRYRIEKRAFSDIRKPHDTKFHIYSFSFVFPDAPGGSDISAPAVPPGVCGRIHTGYNYSI